MCSLTERVTSAHVSMLVSRHAAVAEYVCSPVPCVKGGVLGEQGWWQDTCSGVTSAHSSGAVVSLPGQCGLIGKREELAR